MAQDRFAEDADASTLRLRANYLTPQWRWLQGFAELDYVAEVGPDDFNSGAGTSPGRSRFPVVADPDGEDLNQLWLKIQASDVTEATIGRQRIVLDNQRFVGGVGWRQNEQTYDAIRLNQQLPAEGRLLYAYVDNVNRIFGNDVAAGDHAQSTHLLNVNWNLTETLDLTTYFYDIDNADVAAFSSRTAGLRLTGKFPAFDDGLASWLLELAHQVDAADNPVDYSAGYSHVRLAVPWRQTSLLLGRESLAGDAGRAGAAFRTPLATLHAFNGWADQFLTTPDSGLIDRYAGINGKWARAAWQILYHDFDAESGPLDFGSEIDASVSVPLAEYLNILLKAARFDADAPGFSDTGKYWLMMTWQL